MSGSEDIAGKILSSRYAKIRKSEKIYKCEKCGEYLEDEGYKLTRDGMSRNSRTGDYGSYKYAIWFCKKCRDEAVVERNNKILDDCINDIARMLAPGKELGTTTKDRIKDMFYRFRQTAWD